MGAFIGRCNFLTIAKSNGRTQIVKQNVPDAIQIVDSSREIQYWFTEQDWGGLHPLQGIQQLELPGFALVKFGTCECHLVDVNKQR